MKIHACALIFITELCCAVSSWRKFCTNSHENQWNVFWKQNLELTHSSECWSFSHTTHLIGYWWNWLRAIEIWGCDLILRFQRGGRLRLASTTVWRWWMWAESGHRLIGGRNRCRLGVGIWQWGWSSRGRWAHWWNWHRFSTMQIWEWIGGHGLTMGVWWEASRWST